jgi:hypothetical protein
MKTTGIVFLVLGLLSTLVGIIGAANGQNANFSGLMIVVLGAYLISRANKKKEEEEKRRKWEQGNSEEK